MRSTSPTPENSTGLNKVASLAYRAQFKHWAFKIEAKFNSDVLLPETLAFLIQESGIACGLGEWRNERKGVPFKSFVDASDHMEKNYTQDEIDELTIRIALEVNGNVTYEY